jgi:hypothetical protein
VTALKPCGTVAAYLRHLRYDGEACEACLQANNDRGREERAVYGRAKARAMATLKKAHPDVFDSLHGAERERERRRVGGPLDRHARGRARQAAYRALARELPEEMEPLLAAELDWERQAAAS